MRKLAAMALIFSIESYACPQLSGEFVCRYPDGSSEKIVLSQTLDGNITVYNVNGSNIVADNKVYPVPDDANVRNAYFRAWCDDTVSLKGHLVGQYFHNNAYYGDLDLNFVYLLVNPPAGDLKQVAMGTLTNSSGERSLNSETICARN
jgi:hypothetical protein